MISPNKNLRWFPVRSPSLPAEVQLLAFPHAGGAASSFRSWKKRLPDFIELRAAQLPGREMRFSEPPLLDWHEIVAKAAGEIAAIDSKPIILFGHSMGAVLAFEVARSLRRYHRLAIGGLVVSGHCAPHLNPRSPSVRHLEGKNLLKRLGELYGGIPSEVLGEPELIQLLWRVAQADVTVAETYRYVDELPLDCPLLAFGGKSDPWVSDWELALWDRQTSGPFCATLLPGGHFYLQEAMMERVLITQLIDLCESARSRKFECAGANVATQRQPADPLEGKS